MRRRTASAGGECELGGRGLFGRLMAVRAAGAAGLGAGAKGFVDDGLDGARAAAALGAATEAAIDLLGVSRQVVAALTALRTSWSLRTLQEQTIIRGDEPSL